MKPTTASRLHVEPVTRLYPGPTAEVPLEGLYLDDGIRPAGTPDRPCVYADYVASVDGRISLPDPDSGVHLPPPTITNPRDWRLFQELAACADVLVTSGRYMRDLAAGVAQAGLPVSEKPEFTDLHQWRRTHGLSAQPAVAIVSYRLDLPIPGTLIQSGRPIYVATGRATDRSQVHRLEAKGVRILECGRGSAEIVDGGALVEALVREGFGNIDMTAGGRLLHTLLAAGVLDRLYLTQAHLVLGGESFDTVVTGAQLEPPPILELRSAHYDGAGEIPQLFVAFDVRRCRSGRPA
ncbi:MAG TPA: dihydrofolate reductase family protein [Rhodanobacteraceae bacterium]|nr:dihydrofolate reductase family protein [Rhodanobacteraceae bacterium]